MIAIEVYRARIGLYFGSMKKKKRTVMGLKVRRETISLAVRVTVFALLVLANVEPNPGPVQYNAEKDRLLNSLKDKYDALETKLQNMNEEIMKLVGDNKRLKDKCIELETRCENSEAQSRRQNLILHNIPSKKDGQETWEDTEVMVREHLKSIDVREDVKLERCHRLNPRKKDSAVIVKFSYYKDKERVFAKERERKQEKRGRETRSMRQGHKADENEVYITEDFTARVRRVRSMLKPYMDEAFKKREKVRLAYDRLVIEGKTYWYDDAAKCLVDKKPSVLSCLATN